MNDICWQATSEAARRKMSVDEFYKWLREVEGRYELVDGEPLLRVGATNRHDRIVRNALTMVSNQLCRQRCQPFSANILIKIPAGNRRRCDMGVDCGTPDEGSMDADSPAFVMEVLLPTEGTLDLQDRLEEYKSLQMLEYILLVGLDDPAVRLWRRDADRNWLYEKSLGPEEVLDLHLVALRLPLATLYAGVSF